MSRDEQDKELMPKSASDSTESSVEQYSDEMMEAIRKTTFTTLAVATKRGFSNLKITAVQKLAENLYAVSFTYNTFHQIEKPDGCVTEEKFTEGRGLYVHQFAPALYLDAYAIAQFVGDSFHPPRTDRQELQE